MNRARIGVIGCGNISSIYLENLQSFDETVVSAVADLDRNRAEVAAQSFGVERVLEGEELLSDSEIDVVLNLTTPHAHFNIAKQALLNGKHVYNEKTLTLTADESRQLLDLAASARRTIGIGT